MGDSGPGRGRGGARPRASVQPDERPKRKRGNRKPELADVLTQRGLRAAVKRLETIIEKGSAREAIEAFKLLYGPPGDARRGDVKPGGRKPGPAIVLPDA